MRKKDSKGNLEILNIEEFLQISCEGKLFIKHNSDDHTFKILRD